MFKSRDTSPTSVQLICKSALTQKSVNICFGKAILFLNIAKTIVCLSLTKKWPIKYCLKHSEDLGNGNWGILAHHHGFNPVNSKLDRKIDSPNLFSYILLMLVQRIQWYIKKVLFRCRLGLFLTPVYLAFYFIYGKLVQDDLFDSIAKRPEFCPLDEPLSN